MTISKVKYTTQKFSSMHIWICQMWIDGREYIGQAMNKRDSAYECLREAMLER